jgi:hypothetical protein
MLCQAVDVVLDRKLRLFEPGRVRLATAEEHMSSLLETLVIDA